MKKVSKFVLKENAEVLSKEEMKLILGGAYTCCCYFSNGQTDCSNYVATSLNNAAYDANYACYGENSGDHLCGYAG